MTTFERVLSRFAATPNAVPGWIALGQVTRADSSVDKSLRTDRDLRDRDVASSRCWRQGLARWADGGGGARRERVAFDPLAIPRRLT